MKIDFEGRVWQLVLEDVDMRQGEIIAAYTGLSPIAWYQSLTDVDSAGWLKSVRCLYWLMRDQNDDPVPLEGANFAPLKLFAAFGTAMEADQPAAAGTEADPTKPAGGSAAGSPAETNPSPA